jgi:hypothetical protein
MLRSRSVGVAAFFMLAACGGSSQNGSKDAGSGSDARSGDGAGAFEDAAPPDAAVALDADNSSLDADLTPDANPDATAQPDAAFMMASHPPFPQLVDGRQGVLMRPTLVTVVAANDPQMSSLFTFGDQAIVSNWWTQAAAPYGIGAAQGSLHLMGPAITANISGMQMETYIRNAIVGHANMQPTGTMIYMLYLPPGIDAIDDNTGMPNTSCQFYGGYHTTFGNGPDNWGYAQRCMRGGTTANMLDTLTETGSHEIMESATDPVDGFWLPFTSTTTPWVDSIWSQYYGGITEGGDLCGGADVRIGNYLYQRFWSNSAAQAGGDPCVPAIHEPYYNVSAAQQWYQIQPSQTLHIPITGWSTASMSDWAISASIDTGYDGFSLVLDSPTMVTTPGGNQVPSINNGATATLTVTAPSNAQHGVFYITAEIDSFVLGPSSDSYHFWPIGFYVP